MTTDGQLNLLTEPPPAVHHRHPNTAISELEAARRAGHITAADRLAVLEVIRSAGFAGINTRQIQDALYSFVGIGTQAEGHRIAAKVNKVATRCAELEQLGLITPNYDDRGDRALTETDGRRFLHYWITAAGRTTKTTQGDTTISR